MSVDLSRILSYIKPHVRLWGNTEFGWDLGVSDHGLLTGLGDDDHPQYTTGVEVNTAISDHAAEADPHVLYQKESEKGLPNGYTGLDPSGLVDSAALANAGTPSGSTFLRGDRSWATPAAGGGPTTTRKAGDQSTTSTTLTSAVNMSLPITANRYHWFEFLVLFRSSLATNGIRLAVTSPAGNTRFGYTMDIPVAADGTGATRHGWGTASGDANVGTGVEAINTDYVAYVRGVILPTLTGVVQLQFASELSGNTITMRQGSAGIIYDLGL